MAWGTLACGLAWGALGIKLFQPNKHLIGLPFQQVKLFQIYVFGGARKAEFKIICSHAWFITVLVSLVLEAWRFRREGLGAGTLMAFAKRMVLPIVSFLVVGTS